MEPAPLFAEVAEGPPGGGAWWLHAADGVRLRLGVWPDGGKGTVLLFPGRTEYVEKYGRAAADLCRRGYATAVIDWRGQGLADRSQQAATLGHVESFADYQTDVAALRAGVAALDLPRPHFLLAHSMGGAIGLRALMEGLPVAAVVFSAPMWGLLISPLLRPAARAVTAASRRLGMGARFAPGSKDRSHVAEVLFENNVLTRDRGMFDYMQAQLAAHPELALGGPSLTWVSEALAELRDLAGRPPPSHPALVFVGEQETAVDPETIADRIARWPGARMERIPDARHEVMMDTPETRAHVFDAAAAHFAAHADESASASAPAES